MKNLLLFLPLALLLSCKEQAKQPETTAPATKEAGWTKPMIYIVDGATTYYDNIEDEDFSDYSNLVYEVYKEIYAGKLQAYKFDDGKLLTVDEVKKMSQRVDTMYAENPATKEQEMKIVVSMMEQGIYSVKIKETWRFNKETDQLEKKVIALAPRMPVVSEDGELKGYTPLFWVFFDKQAEEQFKKQFNS